MSRVPNNIRAYGLWLTAYGAAALLFPAAASATKLDLSSNVDIKANNYTNLLTGTEKKGQALYSENATLGFVIKDIRLEKTNDSSMDVGIVLNSVGTGSSSRTLTAPQFSEAAARYPNITGVPFVKEAYVKIYKFLHPKATAILGRQAFTLGQGITLADDGLGLTGARLEAEKLFRGIKGEVFYFRPYKNNDFVHLTSTEPYNHNDGDFVKITGGGLYYPSGEGLWHIYHFWEESAEQPPGAPPVQELDHTSVSRVKKFSGIRYFLNYNQLVFDGEFIVQRGKSKLPEKAGSVKYAGYAFLIKGVWNQDVVFFGPSKARLAYGKSSGNSGPVSDKDKAFLPSFGHRFKGVERDGFGEIAGASLYDIIQTSGTVNGLPNGVSGLNIINVGADMPYKKMILSFDFFKFRATQNANMDSIQIAREWDVKVTYPMGESLRLKAVYAIFQPLSLYDENTAIKLVSISLTAKF